MELRRLRVADRRFWGAHNRCLLDVQDDNPCRSCGQLVGNSNGHQCRRKCLVCGHSACPFCGNWCDVMLEDDRDENGKLRHPFDSDLCCGGTCTYAESSWDEKQFALESQAVIERAIELDAAGPDAWTGR